MYKLLLCLRYLRTRYIALACIVSVTLGVATMIVVNSVMAGFSSEMRDRIHGLLADVVLESASIDGHPDPEAHMARIRQVCGDDIEAMTPTVEVYGMLSFQYLGHWITRPVTLIGIDPEGKAKVGPLKEYLDSYREITDGDTVVRQPLRDVGVPAGWTLTPEAVAHREAVKLHELQYYREQDGETGRIDPSTIVEQPGGETRTAEREFDPSEFDTDEPGEENVADDAPTFDEPPFDPSKLFEDEIEEVDPTAPLRGRLFVGSGLVSFPQEDPQTGKVKTIVMVRPGDDVKISTVTSGRPPDTIHFNATVCDVFKSGMSEYDSSLVFCNLEYLQEVRGMLHPETGTRSITTIQIKLKDFKDADEVIAKLREAFPPGMWSIQTWEEKQGPLLAAVEVESAILNVLLFLIIAVAGFGILAIFFMIVVEKTRDIGILKALGASSRGVMSIFLGYGLALGVVGSGAGVVMGLLFVAYINEIEDVITWLTGREVFDQTIYYFPAIPTAVSVGMVLWVSFGAMLIAVLASILPARRAASLHPVEALRFE